MPLLLCRFGMRPAAVAALVACGDGSGPDDDRLYPQTFEFGNFGCARVAGTVRDGDGQPLAGVAVTLVPPIGATASFDLPSASSEAAGAFFGDRSASGLRGSDRYR